MIKRSVSCFQIVWNTLAEAYREVSAADDSGKDRAIWDSLDYLSHQYNGSLDKAITVNYHEASTRFAYLYKYASTRANLLYQIVARYSALQELLTRDRVRMISIGGGPGTELVGLAKHAYEHQHRATISACILDRESAWNGSWALVSKYVGYYLGDPHRVEGSHVEVDAVDPTTWDRTDYYLSTDLYTMSYFVSEFRARYTTLAPFIDTVFSRARAGALFVFLDLRLPSVYQWFDGIASTHGLERVDSGLDQQDLEVSPDEQPSPSNPIIARFYARHNPHIHARAAHRVYRKVAE